MLTLLATLSFIDRQILNVMIGPVKRDLGGLSDTEISLVIGLAFSLVYSLSTFPLARWADRFNRRNLIAGCVFTWSLATSMAGFANSFVQLFAARMGVGIGEAGLGPATNSMLADLFEESLLPLAYGIVATAPFIGSGLASLVGGPLLDYLEARPDIVLPVFGEVYSWQMVLILVGLPGLLLAAVTLTLREPSRKGASVDSYPLAEIWRFCRSRRRYLGFHFLAYFCLSLQGFAFLTWIIELFVRKHGWTRTEIGISYGVIAIVVGVLGSVVAGFVTGRLMARSQPEAPMRVCFWGTLALAPIAVIMPLIDSGVIALLLIIPITFCMAMPPGLSSAALYVIAPNRMRGQLVAVYLICVSFLSYLFAPSVIAVMNDYVFKSEAAIDLSLASLAAVNYSIACAALLLAIKPLRAAVERLKSEYAT
ncbi:MAG: MFS transporter [Pseudomonadota bacterium]